ncbi:MAG: hypothetical protein H6P99_190 [Holophagaceae bacterium]|nr:hypothetical protein [Holophagaceae bacterium]
MPQFHPMLDHAAMKVADLDAEVARWRRLGHAATFPEPGLAILTLAGGARLALLGDGARHPSHLALRVAEREAFDEIARLEGGVPVDHDDGSRSFYTRGGTGLALEWVWRPAPATAAPLTGTE